jgi:DNA-binding GntR family transcriptional regulator
MEAIAEQIESGALSAGQKLPAERKFAEMFDTTRVTLREALSLLEAEGSIYREDRRGWFISPLPYYYDPTSGLDFIRRAHKQERQPATALVSASSILAKKKPSELLQLPPFSDVYRVEQVYFLENRPVAYVESYLKPNLFPNLLKQDLASNSIAEISRSEYGLQRQEARSTIRSTSLFGEIANALRATAGTPGLCIEKINYDQQGNAIDAQIDYWRHDAIKIDFVSTLS